jgi:hypothetical protein
MFVVRRGRSVDDAFALDGDFDEDGESPLIVGRALTTPFGRW